MKSCFFQSRQLSDGITDVKCPSHSTCLHLVINKDFTINANPLTDEAKSFIEKNYKLNGKWKDRADNEIKKSSKKVEILTEDDFKTKPKQCC